MKNTLLRAALSLAPALLLHAADQPKIEARKAPVITRDGLRFRDLNKNGTLDPYEDWRLPLDRRIADLVSRMTPEEKAGLMIHSSLSGFTGPNGEVLGLPAAGGRGGAGRGAPAASGANRAFQGRANQNNVEPMGSANPNQLVAERNIRYILVRPNAGEPPDITAKFHNALEEMAEASRLGIPIVFSTDPRHGTGGRGASGKPAISQWPDQLGLAAARDPELVRQFGQIAARELRALGIRCLLGPMADTATEPRWNRINGTFGEDANLNATLVKAIVEGFQGKQLGPESVMTVTKHFPGDGPVKDGYDPHNSYGKWTIYPGNQFDHHLIPFRAAIEAGTGGIMGGYFIPVGKDTVAINFSKAMIAGLLREKMGFQGLVVTDWLRNMPWGVEKLSEKDRQKMMVLAGVDQIGGDNDPSVILASVKDGGIPMAVIDRAVRRILRPIFQLGLFENPYVDPERAATTVGSEQFLAAGYAAQVRSTVLLKNAGVLPAATGRRIYVEGISRDAAAAFGTVVDDPNGADLSILRVASPVTNYPYGGAFAPGGMRGGTAPAPPPPVATYGVTLAYGNAANWTVLEGIRRVAASGSPTVVIVNMDKPVILAEFIDGVAAVFGAFGASDRAVLDVVFGKARPTGKLPFDLPGDMPSVMAQAADVPFDMDDPLFKFGFGLAYDAAAQPAPAQPAAPGRARSRAMPPAPKPGICPLPILPVLPALDDVSFFAKTAVPHGKIEQAAYKNYAGQDKRMHIYLPPGYEKDSGARYPVLYLNHGGGDDDSKWSSEDPRNGGSAGIILDNLIAAGKARPMIIVMPNSRGCATAEPSPLGTDDKCSEEYLKDIVPYVDSHYRTRATREGRALAGLSMGGFVVLHTGFPHLDTFSELYIYSSGHIGDAALKKFDEYYGPMMKEAAFNDRFRVPLYMAAGETDIALHNGQKDLALFNQYGVRNFWVLSTGGHEWANWRRYLYQTAQIMFPDCGGK